MVMTSQMSPRLSIRGFALAATLALGGYLATPLWACPPAPKPDEPARARAPKPPKPPRAPRPARRAKRAAEAPMVAPPDAATTFERHMRQGRGDTSLEERIEDLERQIDRLHRELERLLDGLRGGPRAGVVPEVEVARELSRGQVRDLRIHCIDQREVLLEDLARIVVVVDEDRNTREAGNGPVVQVAPAEVSLDDDIGARVEGERRLHLGLKSAVPVAREE